MKRQISLKNLVSAGALLAILVLAVSYLYGGILNRSVTRSPDTFTVSLEVTGGLFPGSGVTYRGVRVGTVDDITLGEKGVTVKARLDTTRDIPADSAAVVRSLSPAGEQFLDIQPRTDGPPYLVDGHLFGRSDTATPTSVASAMRSMDGLLSQVDDEDVKVVLREMAVAFEDPDDLSRLMTEAESTIAMLDENWPATERVLVNGRTVLRTGVDKGDEFRDFAASAKSVAAWLRDYDPKLRSTLDDSPAQIAEVNRLVTDVSKKFPGFLDGTEGVTAIVAEREEHFRALLKAFPQGSGELASTLQGGSLRVDLVPTPSMVCDYGRDLDPPKQAQRRPVVTNLGCDPSFEAQQRGSAHTPPVRR
ncbi:MlaD family protein [Aeromicrobium sp.]|uniref:MlaD family protein n=1 Tax=Aeromicrobium sp. TaxID=1871063 RepID=UPI0030BFA89B